MEGFRSSYEKAVRRDEENGIDWSVHCLDYELFKSRLLFFSDRRSSMRKLLRHHNSLLPAHVFHAIMGPQVHGPPTRIIPMVPPTHQSVTFPSTVGNLGSANDDDDKLDNDPDRDEMLMAEPPVVAPPDSYIQFQDSLTSASSVDGSSETGNKYYKKRTVWRKVSSGERTEVSVFLTAQMDKVALFYVTRYTQLSHQLRQQGPSPTLGHELLELLVHCAINIMALRQSLIRFDAFARTYGSTPMLQWFMKKIAKKRPNSITRILEMQELLTLRDEFLQEYSSALPAAKHDFMAQWEHLEALLKKTQDIEALASTGQVLLRDTLIQRLKSSFVVGAMEDSMAGLDPAFMTLRGTSLTREMKRIAEWRNNTNATIRTTASYLPSSKKSKPQLTRQEFFFLALNVLSAFFYCMNYYIVEPSSTLYVNSLGAPDYISAALIGMMPLAALASAIGYAIWTNHSFRSPLLASSLLLMMGNIVYASALYFENIWIALVGRFMTGLGGPKCIVRRYMADTTPVALRTSVNAAFALAIAVGSALGPATAILLDKFDFRWDNTPFIVNGMTGPGWFMALVWFIFTTIVFLTFQEPDRSGLEEQKRLEEEAAASATVTAAPTTTGSVVGTEDDLNTIFSGDASSQHVQNLENVSVATTSFPSSTSDNFWTRVTPPVRLCLALLYAKTFTIEALVSCTSTLTKNRYEWTIANVGILGCLNGSLVVPLSILVGYLSMYYQDRVLMTWLVSIGCLGMFLLIDASDLMMAPTSTYNMGHVLAVHPPRYVTGYFISYVSIQAFEGVIGSALSKVIPTALASGTFNSGLLATLVDTLGRACGDMFISLMGFISLRQLMNLLFIPAFLILVTCLVFIRKFYDLLAV